jgi:hypothetical protein
LSIAPGPVYTPDDCELYNPLDSDAHCEYSGKGPNGVIVGNPTYAAGQHEEAILIDAVAETVNFTGPQLCPAAATWELWLKPVGWSITDGRASVGIHEIVSCVDRTGVLQFLEFAFYPAGIVYYFRVGGVTIAPNVFTPAIIDAADGTWHHLAYVWDSTGIAGTANTRRIYWDGQLAQTSDTALVPFPVFTLNKPFSLGTYNDVPPHHTPQYDWPFAGYLDELKVFNYAKTDFSDRFTEGFVPASAVPDPPPVLITPRRARVELDGIDVSCRFTDLPRVAEQRGLGSSISMPDSCKVTVENFDNAFSLQHPNSFFAGAAWQNKPMEVWDREGLKIWSGLLSEPQVDHTKRTTGIVSRSTQSEWRKAAVVYTTTGWETPADALNNVAAAIGFPDLDGTYVGRSAAQQAAAGIYIKVTLVAGDNETFGNFVNRMADFGCADVYEHLGKIVYLYEPGSASTPDVDLVDCDVLYGSVKLTRSTREFFNDYAIYESGTPGTVTDATAGNIGAASRRQNGTLVQQRVPSSLDTKYQVQNAAAAQAIGESYIRRSHYDLAIAPRPRGQIQFDVETYHRTWVDLTSDFRLTYAREGWTAKSFRVVGFSRDDSKGKITVTALEWPE